VGIETDVVLSLAFWMFLPGVVCARAFYVIEYWADQYLPVYRQEGLGAAVLAVANFTQGGVVAYGALLGGLLGMLLFVRRHRLPLLGLGDLVTPSIMLGLALGRIGCLLNGCCFGSPCELPWAVTFPAGDWPYSPAYQAQVQRGQLWSPTLGFTLGGGADAAPVVESVDPQSPAGRGGFEPGDRLQSVGGQNVGTAGDARLMLWRLLDEGSPVVLRAEGREPITLPAISIPRRSLPVHPTQVYSSLNALLLCLLLLAYDPFRRRDGELSALMITVYPITRFLLEIVRTDEPPIFGTGLTISQNVSLVVLLCGMGLWFCILRRPPGKAFG
jgi:phosphatidylglycerol:prolipoprotein diacylglycerol transferase